MADGRRHLGQPSHRVVAIVHRLFRRGFLYQQTASVVLEATLLAFAVAHLDAVSVFVTAINSSTFGISISGK
ncbi:hypothetical protein [Lonsdalea quercina]|uniref:hypothetical protein n=1 Tax=Lonsdalea quercina TaxID=71657 RepID=UPI003976DBC7